MSLRLRNAALAGAWLLVLAGPAAAQEAAHGALAADEELLAAPPEVVDEMGAASATLEAGAEEPAPVGPSVGASIEQAWLASAGSLEQRVARTRRAALEVGVWNLDAAARAALSGAFGGDPLERAGAAVRLAPDLPAAHVALARAHWEESRAPFAAMSQALQALIAIPRHTEASLWFGGSLLYILALALIAGGLGCIALAAFFAAPHAAHDLGDALSGSMPAFARAALLGSLLLVPLAMGEGLMGLALGLLAIGVVYGRTRQRLVLALAALFVVGGAFPVARLAGGTLAAFAADPVADAAYRTAEGFEFPVDLARLEAAADRDPLAARALARRARRAGNLGSADAHYQRLLQADPSDPVVANNAANVRLNLGHLEKSLDLYLASSELEISPVVLFNLSQAYGRSFQVDRLEETLAHAQSVDAAQIADLTELQGAEVTGFVVDLPLPRRLIWERVLRSDAGEGIAAELRAPFAPGRLGGDVLTACAAVGAVVFGGGLLGSRIRASRRCDRCGRRICPRCDGVSPKGRSCEGCTRLFHQPETADRDLRAARINALRRRERRLDQIAWVAAVLVPGSAGQLASTPLRGLLGALFAALALMLILHRQGVAPDPLIAGAAAPLGFVGVAVLALAGYALVVSTALAARRSG